MKISTILSSLLIVLTLQSTGIAKEPIAPTKVTTALKTTTSWDGVPLVYPEGKAEITAIVIEIPPGGESGWHMHPVISVGTLLEGELEVQLKSGAAKRFKPGDIISEVVNTWHNGRNVGKGNVKILMFYTGTVDGKLTIKEAVKDEAAK